MTTRASKTYNVPEELFKQYVRDSFSCSEVLRKIGYKSIGGNARDIVSRRIKELQLDTSH